MEGVAEGVGGRVAGDRRTRGREKAAVRGVRLPDFYWHIVGEGVSGGGGEEQAFSIGRENILEAEATQDSWSGL